MACYAFCLPERRGGLSIGCSNSTVYGNVAYNNGAGFPEPGIILRYADTTYNANQKGARIGGTVFLLLIGFLVFMQIVITSSCFRGSLCLCRKPS